MKNYTADQLREHVITTVAAFDTDNVIGSYFVGWQEGFEPTIVEVKACSSMDITEEDALAEAEEAMKSLNRGQDELPDFVVYRKAL